MSHHADGRQGKIQELRRRAMRPAAFLTGLLTTAGFAAGFAISAQGAARPHAITTNNMGFTPLAPSCIADTRAASAGPACATDNGKTLTPGSSLTIDVPSSVPAGAGAVAISVDVIRPSGSGFASVFPAGESFNASNPTANVNFVPGQTVDNIVTTGLGTDSSTGNAGFTIYDGPATGTGGNFDVEVDLFGYYQTNSGSAYNGITPVRADETRSGATDCGVGGTSSCASAGKTLGSGSNPESVTMQVAGVDGVPSNATAVSINLALTNVSGGTSAAPNFVEAFPTGQAQPLVANQNYVAGETLSTQVVVGVGSGGDITIANNAGVADVIVDINGYFASTGSQLNMLASPTRLTNANGNLVAGGASTSVTLQGTGASAAVTNLAECYEGASTNCPPTVPLSGGNFLTAFPTGATQPFTANLNYTTGDVSNVLSNGDYATASSSGGVTVANGPATAGHALVFVDEFGYFAAPTSALTLSASPASQTVGGTAPTITATDSSPSAVGQTVFFFEQDPTGATVKTTNISAAGTTSCVITTSGSCTVTANQLSSSGTSTIGGVLDTDFDSDHPTGIASLDPDNDSEPTATTTVNWTAAAAAGLTTSPGSEDDAYVAAGFNDFCAYKVNSTGSTSNENCGSDAATSAVVGSPFTGYVTVTDKFGNPVANLPVTFGIIHATTANNDETNTTSPTCDPEEDHGGNISNCTNSTMTATTNAQGVASVSWNESVEGEDYFYAFPTAQSSLTSNLAEVVWGTQPVTVTPDYTSAGMTESLGQNATYTVNDGAILPPGFSTPCVELQSYQSEWGNGAQGNPNQTGTNAYFTGVSAGATAYQSTGTDTTDCTSSATPITTFTSSDTTIFVKPPSSGSFTFTMTSTTPSDVANPVASAEGSDFTNSSCDDNPSSFCGPMGIGAATTWSTPLSAFSVSVTPTTNTVAAVGALVQYTESVTVNGSPDTSDLNSFTFSQLTPSGATAASTPGEVAYTETTVKGTTFCVAGAKACPSGDTVETSGTPFTPAGTTTPITITNSAYNGIGTDTQVQVMGTGTFSPTITDNTSAGPSSNGTGPATAFGYVDLNSNGKFDSATEPSGTGGTTTFTSAVPSGAKLVPVQNGNGEGPALADQFSDGNYWHAASPIATSSADGTTTSASTTIGSASLFKTSGQYVGWVITDSKGAIPAGTTVATNGGAGSATISQNASSTQSGDTFTVTPAKGWGNPGVGVGTGQNASFGVVAEVVDQSGNPYDGATISAVTWTLHNTGTTATNVYLTNATSDGTEYCAPGSLSPSCGFKNLGTTSLFPNPENGGTSNGTMTSTTSLTIPGGGSLSFTTYTRTFSGVGDFNAALDSAETSAIGVNSTDATDLSVTAQLASDPSGTAVAGSAIGSPASATVAWAPQPAAGSPATGTITAFDPVESTETEASGTFQIPGSDAIIVQTALGPEFVQYDESGVTNTYTVGGTGGSEAAFEAALADGKTYTMSSYDVSTQTNAVS